MGFYCTRTLKIDFTFTDFLFLYTFKISLLFKLLNKLQMNKNNQIISREINDFMACGILHLETLMLAQFNFSSTLN